MTIDPTEILASLDTQIDQAREHQRNLSDQVDVLRAQHDVAGEYRARLEGLREGLRALIKEAEVQVQVQVKRAQ